MRHVRVAGVRFLGKRTLCVAAGSLLLPQGIDETRAEKKEGRKGKEREGRCGPGAESAGATRYMRCMQCTLGALYRTDTGWLGLTRGIAERERGRGYSCNNCKGPR